ncbi:MAG: hypothetical protein KDE31_02920, partial [Caldilineaceae bacterium]|nr:hypothetical protein [Caldilineaceae bacterium]
RRGDYQHALTYAEKADRLYQTAKPTVEGALLLAITHGSILMNLGHYHQAKAMAEAQVAQCDVRTSPRLVAELQDLLGKIATYAADTPTALRHFTYALELRQRYGDPRELMRSYSYLAVAYSRRWQWRLAENANVTALALAERIGDRAFATQIEANLAAIHLAEGAYFKAIELLEQCQARYEQMDNVVGLQQVTGNLAYAYLKLNRLSQAAAHANRAITMAETIEQPWQLVKSILILGEIEYEQGQLQKARQRCEEAQRLITTTGMAAQSEYFVLLGKIHYHAEQPTQAAIAFQQAVECCLQQEAWAELAQTKLLWARMALHNQERTQAEQLLAEVELLVADNELVGLQQEIRELHEMLAENPS